MREAAVAIGIALVLLVAAWLLSLPSETVMLAGQAVMLGGGGVGLPLELVYFTALGVVLSRRSVLPEGWYWRSFDHHHLLVGRERWIVLPFFYAGAAAFVICMLGIFVALSGLVATIAQLAS